jgi:hypothetical protein
MRLSLVRTGGLAGMRREATLDTERLEPSRAAELRRLFADARLADLAPAVSEGTGSPDRFRYTLTIEEGGRKHTIRFGEDDAPEPALRFVEAVWREASTNPPGTTRA